MKKQWIELHRSNALEKENNKRGTLHEERACMSEHGAGGKINFKLRGRVNERERERERKRDSSKA